LRDPQVVLLETTKGVLIDVEVFVNCRYGYDIQCEVVGEDGIAKLPEPMAVKMRLDATLQNPLLTDWKDRFINSYDVELRDFLKAAAQGGVSGPTSWDGYVAAIASDACVTAQEREGEAVAITLPTRPALYN
jgi:myo-inositol 2-dehydrogenase / D-chiro-inositol 1-dehydrogenase